ncbi:MAG: cation transporter [Chitinophagales bacterium]|nr:MAG: cation transporter [Chitinophagales bacterium]
MLMLIKFAAFFLTGSNAILSDALESVINVVAGSFALYSLVLAAKPSDRDHPYGHGKVEFLSAGLEGMLILAAGTSILLKAGYDLIFPAQIGHLREGIGLIGFTGLINYLTGFILIRYGKKHHSETMMADGKHLLSDAYTTAGLLAGLLVVYLTGITWLDSVIAMSFGIWIAVVGFRIVRKSISGIMDEADFEVLKKVASALESNRKNTWVDIHNIRVIKYGPLLHIDCHLTLPWYFTLRESHHEVEAVASAVNKHIERNVEFFIHTDPCIPDSCKICQLENCPVRQHPFIKKITWDLDAILRNEKHSIEK